MHFLTQSALLRALGWSLFNSLWQMSLLWAFYHLFLLVFKQLHARARHGLALLLLSAGLLWSAITFITTYLFMAGQPLGTSNSDLFSTASGSRWPALFPGSGEWSFLSGYGFQTVMGYGRRLAAEILPWCSSLYLLILAGLLVHYSRQYIQSKRIVREGLFPLAPDFGSFVSAAARRMGIRTHVDTHLSSLVKVPVTLGFLKPVILLPVAMVTQLTTAQIEAILVHELAHIRRKDYLLNLLTTVMELLFFFNPFTRLLIAQLKKEREHCCDDAVLEFQYDPHTYVSALLSLARQHQQANLAVAAIGGGGEQLLLQRAKKILQQKRTDERPGLRPMIGLLLTTLFSVLLLGHTRPIRSNRPPAQLLVFRQPVVVGLEGQPVLSTPVSSKAIAIHHHHSAGAHALPHSKRRPQDLLAAMLAESVPMLNTAARPGAMPTPAFARLKEVADRDFSIGMGKSDGAPDVLQPEPEAMEDNMPFVPQSSFSIQYTDTLPPGLKLALMQELSQKALRLQIARVQEDLKQQELVLRSQEAAVRRAAEDESRSGLNTTLDTNALQDLLQQQLQVQQQYLLNLQKLQRQLQKAARHLTIVYI
jgi:beta-lactamase regulating signal transducer with metallopeptidase domain